MALIARSCVGCHEEGGNWWSCPEMGESERAFPQPPFSSCLNRPLWRLLPHESGVEVFVDNVFVNQKSGLNSRFYKASISIVLNLIHYTYINRSL